MSADKYPSIFSRQMETIVYILAIFELPVASVSKRVLVQSLSSENKFDSYENDPAGRSHFHMKGLPRRLVATGNGLLQTVNCYLSLKIIK